MRKTLFVALAFAASAFTPAAAILVNVKIKAYFPSSPDVPTLESDYLSAHPNSGIEVYDYGNPNVIYIALGPVARSAGGVCRYARTEVSPSRLANRTISWTDTTTIPSSMALLTDAPCPRQGDQRYIGINGDLSDTEFVELIELWHRISTSEAEFDHVLAAVPSSPFVSVSQFKGALFHPYVAPFQLATVSREHDGLYRIGFGSPRPEGNLGNFVIFLKRTSTGLFAVDYQVWVP